VTDGVQLDPGERLIWSGQPEPRAYAVKRGLLQFLFGIPFFAFAVFWTTTASSVGRNGITAFIWLWGVPFLLAGVAMLLSPFWYYTRARRTRYALTDRRAVMATAGAFPVRTSVPLEHVPFIDVELKADKSGHLLFREVTRPAANGTWRTKDGFIAVRDVENLERLFRDAIARLKSPQRRGAQ
jgi:hypothetical protein